MRETKIRGSLKVGLLLALVLALVAACAPVETPQPVLDAAGRFAEARDVPANNVEIIETEEVTWEDSCLEMGPLSPAEDICEDQETPGYRIVVELNEEAYTLRSDASGVLVRWEGQVPPVGVDISQDVEVFVSLDSIAGVSATQELVPFEDENGMWEVSPQHVRVTLEGYPLEQTAFEAQMRIYEVAELEAVRSNVEQILLEHQQILVAVPDELERDTLLFTPLIEANQQFYAHPQRVEFQDGDGYRFLTQYGGEDEPVASDTLFYAYHGLTEDDNYLVTAIFPVSHPDLGEGATAETVREAEPDTFAPELSRLDAIIQSVVLGGSP